MSPPDFDTVSPAATGHPPYDYPRRLPCGEPSGSQISTEAEGRQLDNPESQFASAHVGACASINDRQSTVIETDARRPIPPHFLELNRRMLGIVQPESEVFRASLCTSGGSPRNRLRKLSFVDDFIERSFRLFFVFALEPGVGRVEATVRRIFLDAHIPLVGQPLALSPDEPSEDQSQNAHDLIPDTSSTQDNPHE